jgi:hypothetical protein
VPPLRGAKLGRREYSRGRGILQGVAAFGYEEDGWTSISRHLTTTKCRAA